jgi:hypothetical protein
LIFSRLLLVSSSLAACTYKNPDQAKKVPDYLQLCYIHYPEIHKKRNKRKALHT